MARAGVASRESGRRRRAALITVPPATSAAVRAAVLTAGTDTGPGDPVTDQEAVGLLNRIATLAAPEDAGDIFRRSDWQAVDGKRAGLARITVLSGPSGRGTKTMRLDADPNAVTYRELQALPTDPAAPYRKIWADTEGQEPTQEEAALETIGAALYRAAARIPGVFVVEDAAGRRGIGLAFADGDDRDVWVFDRTTLHYLGSDEVALLDVGVVNKIGKTPGD
ncbi:hypothetical protein [Streptomyces himalayensis]|uniref:Uncharacterized protein n=1 Tax=Streptomyces himalayensis subsp. himalayensis TaxID=2756131 RepID=A0A7W0DRX9_9ACTN|nr:hypothetical protein [Streptomyces himalayensis]MBA2949648.1 hypothetical protein [Streptomyces himalayensis subsp. himalayensis]